MARIRAHRDSLGQRTSPAWSQVPRLLSRHSTGETDGSGQRSACLAASRQRTSAQTVGTARIIQS